MATKKSSAKKSVKKVETKEVTSPSQSSKVSRQTPKISKKIAITVIALVVIGILLYLFRGLFVAATVNGEPISRLALVKELEGKYGKQTMDSFVAKTVIFQEMKKRNITVSDEEVNSEIKKAQDALKAQGLTLEEALAQKSMSKEELVDQIKVQKMVEKLFGKDVKVTDKEIQKYMEDNKDVLPPATEATEAAQLKEQVKQQLSQQQLAQKFQEWLAPLQQKAKVQYFVTF